MATGKAGISQSKKATTGLLVAKGSMLAFILVTSLFFLWAIGNNFNDILIKQFQKALDLTRTQSGLVQTAFYLGYFTMALPAGWFMQRFGYKAAILAGLCLYALGAVLFYPAAEIRQFAAFLGALYIIAAGLAFLETSANPYITALGPSETAAQRLNLAQSFNGFGGFLAPFIGGALIFSGVEYSAGELAALTPEALEAYRVNEARAVQLPYLTLALTVLVIAAIIYSLPFPKARDDRRETETASSANPRPVWRETYLLWAVFAQFAYVGTQIGIWSYFINFSQDLVGVGEKEAANYLGISLLGFMIGRFVSTAVMKKVNPRRMLSAYSIVSVSLCVVAMLASGWIAVFALGLTSFFMSIMFPTIFALGIRGLGGHTKIGSSLLIMAIVGGAVFPPLMGVLADVFGSIQVAVLVPLTGFVVVALFGFAKGPQHSAALAP